MNSLAKVILFLLTSIFLLDIIKKNIVDTIKWKRLEFVYNLLTNQNIVNLLIIFWKLIMK